MARKSLDEIDEQRLQEQTLKFLKSEWRKSKKTAKTSDLTNDNQVSQVNGPVSEESAANSQQTNQGPGEQPETEQPKEQPPVEQLKVESKTETTQSGSGEPSIFDIARNKTAEDAKIKDKPKPEPGSEEEEEEEDETTKRVKDFNDTSGIPDDPTVITKESLKLKAKTRTEITDVLLVFSFCIISLDFEFKTIDTWKLKKERKEAITQAWYGVLLQQKKHASPSKELWFLVIGSYGPFLIMAIASIFKSIRLKREAAAEAQKQLEERQRQKKEQEKTTTTEPEGKQQTNGHSEPGAGKQDPDGSTVNFKPDGNGATKPKRPGPHKSICDFIKYKGKKSCTCK